MGKIWIEIREGGKLAQAVVTGIYEKSLLGKREPKIAWQSSGKGLGFIEEKGICIGTGGAM